MSFFKEINLGTIVTVMSLASKAIELVGKDKSSHDKREIVRKAIKENAKKAGGELFEDIAANIGLELGVLKTKYGATVKLINNNIIQISKDK